MSDGLMSDGEPRRKIQARKSNRRAEEPPWMAGFRAIERWAREEYSERVSHPALLPDRTTLSVELPLSFRAPPGEDAAAIFQRSLLAAIRKDAMHVMAHASQVEEGHIYCLWCGSSTCGHSAPGDSREVFVGYDQTGKPRWQDFASHVVEARDPRMERLYQGRPAPLALHQSEEWLRRDLLQPFRDQQRPRIIGQFIAGIFPTRDAVPESARRGLAFTAQMLEHELRGEAIYTLNLVAGLPPGTTWGSIQAEREPVLLARLLEQVFKDYAQLRTTLLHDRGSGALSPRKRTRAIANEILERAPAHLEKLLRQGSRRTQHAQERARDPSRPTATALSDALAAKDAAILFDAKEGTWVVRGKGNRVHVFRSDGTHITSLHYPGESIEERLRTRRWVAPEEPEREAFRAAIVSASARCS